MNQAGANPFTVLTLIAAPAVLTNASSVLALGTSNRLARVVDRARELTAKLQGIDETSDSLDLMQVRQLDRVERRALLLVKALLAFYLALGSFAAASLISLIGASVASSAPHYLFRVVLGVSLTVGVGAVSALVAGCTLLVRDSHLAVLSISEEAKLARVLYHRYLFQKTDNQ